MIRFQAPVQAADGPTLESQGSAKLASNLVDRLRNINPYSPQQVVEVCQEAAEALEASGG